MQEKNNGLHQACAACKHQRKRCTENCVLAPYFPSSKNKEFEAVHKIFGVSNIAKILKSIKNHDDRKQAASTLIWEAQCRENDPVNGSYGYCKKLENKINLLEQKICLDQITVNDMATKQIYMDNRQKVLFYNRGLLYNNPSFVAGMYYPNLPQVATPYNCDSSQVEGHKGIQEIEALPGCISNSTECISDPFVYTDQYAEKLDENLKHGGL